MSIVLNRRGWVIFIGIFRYFILWPRNDVWFVKAWSFLSRFVGRCATVVSWWLLRMASRISAKDQASLGVSSPWCGFLVAAVVMLSESFMYLLLKPWHPDWECSDEIDETFCRTHEKKEGEGGTVLGVCCCSAGCCCVCWCGLSFGRCPKWPAGFVRCAALLA